MTTMINDPEVQRAISEANSGTQVNQMPEPEGPSDTIFQLAAPYLTTLGGMTKEFEVRELTGRDEEALSHIKDVGRTLVAMVERAVVRIGPDEANAEALDSLVGGDWDTALMAVRVATFGPTVNLTPSCQKCGFGYEVTIDLTKDLNVRTSDEVPTWTVKGRRSTYEVGLYTGATQRKIFSMMAGDKTAAEINTLILADSVQRIDGRVPLGESAVLDLPLADRQLLLDSIADHQVGPDLQGVTIKCPTCGFEQANPLNAAALFRRD